MMSNNQPQSVQLTELSDGYLVCDYRKTDLVFSGSSVRTQFLFECYDSKWEVTVQSSDSVSSIRNLLISITCREAKRLIRAKFYVCVSQKTYVEESQISLRGDFKRISDSIAGTAELRPVSSGIQRNFPFEVHVKSKFVPDNFLLHIVVPTASPDEATDPNTNAQQQQEQQEVTPVEPAWCKPIASLETSDQAEFSCDATENVRLICGSAAIYANKAELMRHSPVFHKMFSGNFTESSNNEVFIKDTNLDALRAFIVYATILHDSLIAEGDPTFLKYGIEIFVLSDKYEVTDLRKRCLAWLWNNLSVDSCIAVLIASHEHCEERLKARCVKFVAKRCNVESVFCTESWLRLCASSTHTELRQLVDLAVAHKLASSAKRPLTR